MIISTMKFSVVLRTPDDDDTVIALFATFPLAKDIAGMLNNAHRNEPMDFVVKPLNTEIEVKS
jgi:hypothetical protein